jgi:transposase
MADLAYREVYAMSRVEARQHLVRTYQQTGSIRATARWWHTSRQVVRKWVSRFQQQDLSGLQDHSRRPLHSPRQTAQDIEQRVLQAWQETHYGRKRLALYLRAQGLCISAHTVRHILRRHRLPQPKVHRKSVYPALWAWETESAFALIQTDVKDIHDKGALGTAHVHHLTRQHLPRYQYTACDGRTRLRFLGYGMANNSTNGLAFVVLVLCWLRALGIDIPIAFQTDWGQEFGGDNPAHVAELSARYLQPLQAELRRYPMGRKGYNGRVERSHRTDDEEFYAPYLLQARTQEDFLALSYRWLYVYNVLRPHFGIGMEGCTPFTALRNSGYTGGEQIALLPPILLDPISSDLLLSCDSKDGNDLLATYSCFAVLPFTGLKMAAGSRLRQGNRLSRCRRRDCAAHRPK